jgi:hypothetical protein
MRAFELALSPDKTRLIRFGRHAAKQRQMRGEGNPKPSTSLASRTSAHGHANGAPLSLGARRASNSATATGGQGGVAQKNARLHSPDRCVGRANAPRASELLRRSRERPVSVVVLQRGALALAKIAQATQPACVPQLGCVHPAHRLLLSANTDITPSTVASLRRQNPREEPGALAAPAGIRAGGEEQSSSLPRPSGAEKFPGT